jgi:hypothetical protein
MDGNTRLSTATAAAALKASFGTDGQPGSYTDNGDRRTRAVRAGLCRAAMALEDANRDGAAARPARVRPPLDDAGLAEQTERIEHEAGVRKQL